jgi:benzoylformate decarboxylase
LFAGFLPADRNRIVARLAGHDFILVLGAPAFTYHMEGSGPHIPDGAELLQLIDDPSIGAWSPAGSSIFTSLKPGVRALLDAAKPLNRSAPQVPERAPRLPRTKLTDAYLMQQIAALRPAGSIIVEEAPSSRHAMHDYLPLIERDTFYTCASGGLGYSLPAAVGVAMARPKEKVIALIGDGSSMYSIQALWSAAQAALPIAFIIVRNGNYEALTEFGRRFAMPDLPGTQLPAIDFCGLARAQGVAGIRVERIEELDAALQAVFQSSQPMLVEVVVAPSR